MIKKLYKKRRLILLIIFIILLLITINMLIPIKNISSENIKINLSTIKPTGDTIKATISTSTNYNIFYYIDYQLENEYFEESFENEAFQSNFASSTSSQNENSQNLDLEIKDISNKEYKKLESNTLQIENNGIIYLKYGKLGKLSKTPYIFKISNIDRTGPEIIDISTTPTDSSVSVSVKAIDLNSTKLSYYFKIDSDKDYISTNENKKYDFKGLTTDETYTIYIKVVDEFGNESEAVTDVVISSTAQSIEKKLYHFKVNLAANTVTVYDKDENGKYTNPIKAMVCSTGKATPKSGTYKTYASYRWLTLVGGVYGQYAVRIHGSILFHSVPYLQMYPDTLEYEEYDKLGTKASAGCIRLSVKDAKWIYDNAKIGSSVEFYSDSQNPGPLGKPTAQKISSYKDKRNWDPTDPDERNPWIGGNGIVPKNVKPTNVINEQYTNTSNTTNPTNEISNTNNNEISNSTNTIIYED